MTACRLGVLALGDSITNGHGGMQSGLGSQSWAQWLAQAMGLPFTKLARDGATATDVLAEQVPAITGERYDLGCLYVGVNDVRGTAWDAAAYARDVAAIAAALDARCDRLLLLTVPTALGLPPAGAKVEEANAAVERIAAEHGAAVADLRDFAGRAWVWADRVHATATGQIEIADRAARALGAPLPSVVVAAPPRPDLAYAYHFGRRAAREHARAAWCRAHLRVTGRLPA